MGDPLTLTLYLKGQGTMDQARAPALDEVPEITERFKVYDATEETLGNTRTFTYSLRPREAGITTFPAVAFSYFDVNRERYVTLNTDPIPLEIEEADRLAEGDIIRDTGGSKSASERIEARKEGIFANITDPGAINNETVHVVHYAALLGGMIVFYALFSLVTHRIRKVSGDPAIQRRRSAKQRARKRLQQGIERVENGGLREGADQLRAALTGLVADAADLPEGGMTGRDIQEKLENFETDPDLIIKVTAFLEACDRARFGAIETKGNEFVSEARDLL
ncbi:MAG: BatD family protein, partial [Planctomycetes bacterium]|nr:BatD family protein [Planctomycetota bacterium]